MMLNTTSQSTTSGKLHSSANFSKVVVNVLHLKVMEAEQTKTRSELLHKETAARYNAAMSHMKQLEKKLKRTISKSK